MDGFKKIELYQDAVKFEMLGDYREAFNLYLESAKQGYVGAQLAVAKFYLGEGVYKGIIEADNKKAIKYLELAQSGGNAEAKYKLAVMLLKNENSEDAARALELLKDATVKMYHPAAFELARCYFNGIGCQKDYAMTLKLIGKILYVNGAFPEMERCIGIRKILCDIKALLSENKETGLSESDIILLNDMCSDLNVDD